MPQPAEFARPVMRPGTSFYADQTGRQASEEFMHLFPPQLPTQDYGTLRIDAVKLEDGFGEINADRDRLFHGWLPSWAC
jgi:hypothetical protein